MKTNKGGSMLYSINSEGKIKLHRDLSKWRRRTLGKKHTEYYDEAPSQAERVANAAMQVVIRQQTKELSLDQECVVAVLNMKRAEARERLLG